jgi:hypothetical protein
MLRSMLLPHYPIQSTISFNNSLKAEMALSVMPMRDRIAPGVLDEIAGSNFSSERTLRIYEESMRPPSLAPLPERASDDRPFCRCNPS